MSSLHPTPASEPFRLLVMCTANRCRSPMAQVLAQEHLVRRGVDAVVVSAGMMEGGSPATGGSIGAMRRRGLDLKDHRSHQLDADTVGAADLILTMERRHLAAVGELDLAAVERSFTLRELAELAPVVGWRSPVVPVAEWIRRAASMRLPGVTLSAGTDMDVEDPMGGPRRAYRRTADELDELLGSLFDVMFPTD